MKDLAVSEDKMDQFTFYNSYYTVFVPLLSTIVSTQRDDLILILVEEYEKQ